MMAGEPGQAVGGTQEAKWIVGGTQEAKWKQPPLTLERTALGPGEPNCSKCEITPYSHTNEKVVKK